MNKPLFYFQVFAALACAGFTAHNVYRGTWVFAALMAFFTAMNAYNAYNNFKAGSR